MPFPTAYSSDNLETVRGGYSAEQLLVFNPNAVIFQCNPSVTVSADVNTTLTFASTLAGDKDDIKVGMTVLITPTSSYTADWNTDRPNSFRGRIRKDGTATTIELGPTAFQWSTSMFVTVLKDFQPHEKLYRVQAGGAYTKDWDIFSRAALPRITNLQSAYIVEEGATLALAPTVTPMASGASISSYTWDIDGNAFDVGSSSTQNITASFAATGAYWFYFTATDDNDNLNWFAFLVAVIPVDRASVINLTQRDVQISRSLEDGATASLDAFGGVSSLLDNTICVIFRDGRYADGTTSAFVNVIDFIGYLQQDDTLSRGDMQRGIIKSSRIQIEGIGAQMGRLGVPPLPLRIDESPDSWGDFESLTPFTALWYLLSEHTTIANISAQLTPTDITDFATSEFNTIESTILDACTQSMSVINALPNFAATGEIQWERSAVYLTDDSKRDALTAIAECNWRDWKDFNLQRDTGRVVGQMTAGAAMFNTTTRKNTFFRALAPTVREEGAESQELNSQVLASDASIANAKVEAGKRAANHRAAANPTPVLEVTLLGGYTDIIPTCYQWYTFTITSTENDRGLAYDTNDRWLCVQVDISHDQSIGRRQVQARFRLETKATLYKLWASVIPLTNVTPNPIVPPTFGQPWLPEDNSLYYPDAENITPGQYQEPYPYTADNQPLEGAAATAASTPPNPNCESLSVPFTGGAVSMSKATSNGATYQITVEGDARIAGDGWCIYHYFTDESPGNLGWSVVSGTWPYDSGGIIGLGSVDVDSNQRVDLNIAVNRYLTSVTMTMFGVGGGGSDLKLYNGATVIYDSTLANGDKTATPNQFVTTLRYYGNREFGWGLQAMRMRGKGTNPYGPNNCGTSYTKRGDAFYEGYEAGAASAYAGAGGLNIQGSGVSPKPDYDESHSYTFTRTGDGNVWVFSYIDPDSDYSDNENKSLRLTICKVG